jgi:hypothetical protein
MAALPLSLAKTKPKYSKNTIATQAKKEMTIVVYATTVPDLVIINIVLCGFICFGEFVKGIVVIPL